MAFFSKLFSLGSRRESDTAGWFSRLLIWTREETLLVAEENPLKGNYSHQPQFQRKVLGHDLDIPVQIIVDYRGRSPSDSRSPLTHTFPSGLTYPDDLYGNVVLSLDYSPLSSPSLASIYTHCEADDELGLSPSSASSFNLEPEPPADEPLAWEISSDASSYASDSDSSFGPCYTVTVPAKITLDDIEHHLQDAQVRLLRSCKTNSERDRLFRYVVLGIWGKGCHYDSDEESEEPEKDPKAVAWVIHAPRPTHVFGFKYERG